MRSFDVVFSFGGNCAAALQMNHRGLRYFSAPLDWVLMEDERPLDYLPHGLRTRFRDMCLLENLVECRPPAREHHGVVYCYEDTLSGFKFVHHFHRRISEPGEFESVKKILNRRINRFYDVLSSASTAYGVLETSFPFDLGKGLAVVRAFKEVFPRLDLTTRIMQFSAPKAEQADVPDEKVELVRYCRPRDVKYDMAFTSVEWSFLDEVSLVGNSEVEASFRLPFKKLKYKLWKHLSGELERAGTRCVGMIFPHRK